jgi:hypothetical protein
VNFRAEASSGALAADALQPLLGGLTYRRVIDSPISAAGSRTDLSVADP